MILIFPGMMTEIFDARHKIHTSLPAAIKFFKQKYSNRTSPTDDPNPTETTPLIEPLEDDPQSSPPIRTASKVDSVSFDLGLAKFSLVVDIVSFLCMGLARTGREFTIFGVFVAFGLGFNPAIHTMTLAFFTRPARPYS